MSARRDNGQEALLGEAVRGWRVVVTGGAGFLGSHLCTRLLDEGAEVVALDNLITGTMDNLTHLMGREEFRFVRHDVTDYLHVPGKIDAWFRTHVDIATEQAADLSA